MNQGFPGCLLVTKPPRGKSAGLEPATITRIDAKLLAVDGILELIKGGTGKPHIKKGRAEVLTAEEHSMTAAEDAGQRLASMKIEMAELRG